MIGHARSLALFVLLALVPSTLEARQTPPADATSSVLDGVFTDAQAERGKRVYDGECSLCHGPTEFSGRAFLLVWGGQPLGSLFSQIRMTMPMSNPGHLSPRQYAEVVAYMLKLNDFPAGEVELPSEIEALRQIRIERHPDSR